MARDLNRKAARSTIAKCERLGMTGPLWAADKQLVRSLAKIVDEDPTAAMAKEYGAALRRLTEAAMKIEERSRLGDRDGESEPEGDEEDGQPAGSPEEIRSQILSIVRDPELVHSPAS